MASDYEGAKTTHTPGSLKFHVFYRHTPLTYLLLARSGNGRVLFCNGFFYLSDSNLRARHAYADRGNCYGYMWYRCNFSKQVLLVGNAPQFFVGGQKPETLQWGLWTLFALFS